MFDVKTMNGSSVTAKIGRDRVDREDHVGRLDHDQHHRAAASRSRLPFSTTMKCVPRYSGDGRARTRATSRSTGLRSGCTSRVALHEQLDAGEHQEARRRRRSPSGSAASSAAPARMNTARSDERAEDAPEQHAVLAARAAPRSTPKIDEEDEEVVDRERLLDQVAGQELERALRAEPEVHADVEDEREADPDARSRPAPRGRCTSCALRWNTPRSSASIASTNAVKPIHIHGVPTLSRCMLRVSRSTAEESSCGVSARVQTAARRAGRRGRSCRAGARCAPASAGASRTSSSSCARPRAG